MALVTPYCKTFEADSYLSSNDAWLDLDDDVKENALFWGRVYLDSNYRCVKFLQDDAPDEIKFANALLAYDYTQGKLIKKSGTVNGNVTLKRVKAGKVEVETRYNGAHKTSEQVDVDYLLSSLCNKKGRVSFINRV